jgi:RNA polymerase sigma-70 factor (ECF subfamily)
MAAFGLRELIDAHYEQLYRYAYRLSGNASDAEDLVQETFGKAMRKMEQLRNPERVKPWLYRILRNLYLHRVRDEKRRRIVPMESLGDLPGRESEATGVGALDPQRLQAALDELDETFRTPLILFYFEGFSYREIAEQMDLPIGTVMSRLARAKSYLKTQLADDTEGDG